jgi:hypothetical protein
MNLRRVRIGSVIALLLFGLAIGSYAQDTTRSLTQDFPKLSAKERARIAAREADEAKQDQAYQGVMQSGEKAFQEGHYDEALHLFEQARAMRPYNVYPKVKIEDLRALMARQAAVPNDPPPSDPVELPVERTMEIRPGMIPPPPPTPAPNNPDPRGSSPQAADRLPDLMAVSGSPAEPDPDPAIQPLTLKKAEGVIERRYKDGRAFVIERIVRLEGRTVTYKRVYHPFGQVFFFEDGLSVDERVWKARFQGR